MRQHFRALSLVYDTTGRPLIFRYYDPRVLRDFLPTCTPQELTTFFGNVTEFLVEDEDPATALRFAAPSGELKRDALKLGAA